MRTGCIRGTYQIADDAKCHPLVKLLFPGFLHFKVTLFLFPYSVLYKQVTKFRLPGKKVGGERRREKGQRWELSPRHGRESIYICS